VRWPIPALGNIATWTPSSDIAYGYDN